MGKIKKDFTDYVVIFGGINGILAKIKKYSTIKNYWR